MNITLAGQQVEFDPYYFTNNKLYTNTPVSQGSYWSLYEEQGQIFDLTPYYEETFLFHMNDPDPWTSGVQLCATYTVNADSETPIESTMTENIVHNPGEDFLRVTYKFTHNNQTLNRIIYYPRYSPWQNWAFFGYIQGKNQTEGDFQNAFWFGDPCYKLMHNTDGGFYHAVWNSSLPGIQYVQCDWPDLSRYPSPDTDIPLNQNFRGNYFAFAIGLVTTDSIIFNNYKLGPLTPDDDTNQPETSPGPYHDYSDPVDFSNNPTWGPLDTGFIKAYILDAAKARAIATFMLTDNYLVNVKKLFLQPIDYILSLHFLPVTPTGSTSINVEIGGVDTGVSAQPTYENYIDFNSGTIKLDEFWGSFLDYSPTTRVSIFIPFVGIKELNTDDVMTGELTLCYHINTLDGDFICELKSNTTHKLNGVINTYQGNMRMATPITSTDYTNKYTQIFNGVTNLAVGAAAQNPAMAISGAISIAGGTLMKPDFSKSGEVAGGAGMLGCFTPYLIKVRPKQALPKFYTKLFGKPSMIGGSVDIFSGYTEFKSIDLSGIACTESERAEIEQLMKGGVFI